MPGPPTGLPVCVLVLPEHIELLSEPAEEGRSRLVVRAEDQAWPTTPSGMREAIEPVRGRPTRTLDAVLHEVAPGTTSTTVRHSWNAILFAVEGPGWSEVHVGMFGTRGTRPIQLPPPRSHGPGEGSDWYSNRVDHLAAQQQLRDTARIHTDWNDRPALKVNPKGCWH